MSENALEILGFSIIFGIPALIFFVSRKHVRGDSSPRGLFDSDRAVTPPRCNVDGTPMHGGFDSRGKPFGFTEDRWRNR